MNKPSAITARVDADTVAIVDRLAKAQGISRAGFAAAAIRRVAESEADFEAFLKVGIDAIERGEIVRHEQVMDELDAMIEKRRRQCGE